MAAAGKEAAGKEDGAAGDKDKRHGAVARIVGWPLLGAIWVYRHTVSPLLGVNCRFAPSCSEYASEALREYGGIRGGWLAVKRIGRCHPWGGSGYDPVPPRTRDAPAETER